MNNGMYDKTKSRAWYKRLDSAGLACGKGKGSLFMTNNYLTKAGSDWLLVTTDRTLV
jgi:hypothetical protein